MMRWLGAGVLGLHFACGSGCVYAQPSFGPGPGELLSDLSIPAAPRARGQRPEDPPSRIPPLPLPQQSPALTPPGGTPSPAGNISPPPNPAQLQTPQPILLPPSAMPSGTIPPGTLAGAGPTPAAQLPSGIAPPPANLGLPAPPKLPPSTSSTTGIRPASLNSRTQELMIAARVNGKPLFVKEIQIGISREEFENRMKNLPPSLQLEERDRMQREALDDLIDREVAYQEAIRKLQQINPKALDKLKEFVGQEVDKTIATSRRLNPNVSEQEIERSLPELRRRMEREIIASEFLRSKVSSNIQVYFDDVKDYYETHKQEFQRPAHIEWQDIFIAAGTPKCSTVAQARQYAQGLLKTLGPGDDLTKLIAYDDGVAKLNQARGLGTQVGKIQPAEVEPHLLKLKEGQIGPIVELPTGVHIIRLVKHEAGGVIPLDEKTQTTIRNTLRRQIVDREIKRVAKELRARAVVEIEPH